MKFGRMLLDLKEFTVKNPDAEISVPFQHNQYHPHNSIGEWADV